MQRRANSVAAAGGRRVIAKANRNPRQNPPRGYAAGYARGGLLLVSLLYSVFSIQYSVLESSLDVEILLDHYTPQPNLIEEDLQRITGKYIEFKILLEEEKCSLQWLCHFH